MIFLSDNVFDVNDRAFRNHSGELLWRVSLTTDAPLAINSSSLFGLAAQLELTQADVAAVLGTEDFPPQLIKLGQPPRSLSWAQWPYKPAVAALLALKATKNWDDFVPE